MSKNTESQWNVISNEDVSAASFITFHDDNIEKSDKQYIVANI